MKAQTNFHPLLKGAIELHVHSSPSIFPRKQTDWELIEDAYQAGMGGVVLKAHEGQTYDRATLLQEKYPSLKIFGGLVCNLFSGGLSPYTVNMALQMGAKVIWMPTISAKQHQDYYSARSTGNLFNSDQPLDQPYGIKILDENERLLPEVNEILSLIAEKDTVLATGHLSPHEVEILVNEAQNIGVKRILIQHADLGIAKIPFEMQKELAEKGCILEKCYLACSTDFNSISIEQMADSIQKLGASSCVLVTDYGQQHHIPPIEALSEFIEKLLDQGIREEDIQQMLVNNTKQLLDFGEEQ
ncbi:hypothetical protein EV207_11567 [Scopulibacillus darangshiensis]|uniref:Cytosolic protein n=1 Tax=Scopulibacillus darangshiensis TaxID=442528 RepID=A0A4R2P4G9_9BACL|nr:DUF6282 family protein [Scopulibacillus darangshiensis]TCP28831.1 hypothetical protein EV207_11567 [Scopulibacillus darangshiensis]